MGPGSGHRHHTVPFALGDFGLLGAESIRLVLVIRAVISPAAWHPELRADAPPRRAGVATVGVPLSQGHPPHASRTAMGRPRPSRRWRSAFGSAASGRLGGIAPGRCVDHPVHADQPCPPLAPPAPGHHLIDIRDNLIARIAEAEREGWLGEVEGLHVSLASAEDKLAQLARSSVGPAVDLPMPMLRSYR